MELNEVVDIFTDLHVKLKQKRRLVINKLR